MRIAIGLVAKMQVSYSVFFASTLQILFKFYTLVDIAKRKNICKLFKLCVGQAVAEI